MNERTILGSIALAWCGVALVAAIMHAGAAHVYALIGIAFAILAHAAD